MVESGGNGCETRNLIPLSACLINAELRRSPDLAVRWTIDAAVVVAASLTDDVCHPVLGTFSTDLRLSPNLAIHTTAV